MIGSMEIIASRRLRPKSIPTPTNTAGRSFAATCPAVGPTIPEAAQAEQVALAAHRILGCAMRRGWTSAPMARATPQFMEVNPVAGLHPKDSDLPIICRFFGMAYQELIQQIVAAASCHVPETAAKVDQDQIGRFR